jgi:hypothetical protein
MLSGEVLPDGGFTAFPLPNSRVCVGNLFIEKHFFK